MKVFLTGATGVVGRPTVKLLVAAGHEVSAVARGAAKAAAVAAAGATPVSVDLFDAGAVKGAVAGHEAVVNLATHIPPMSRASRSSAWTLNDRLRREASANLVDAALATGAARYMQESVTFAYSDGGDGWIDENHALDPVSTVVTAMDAEAEAARFSAAGGTGVVLRFALFYGPGSDHSATFLRWARRRVGFTAGPAGGFISSIHHDDAGAAVAAALELPAGTYNVSDDEPVTRRDFAAALGSAVGHRPLLRFPGRLATLGGKKAAALTRSHRITNRRLREASGWTPRWSSVLEGWPAVAAVVSRNGEPSP